MKRILGKLSLIFILLGLNFLALLGAGFKQFRISQDDVVIDNFIVNDFGLETQMGHLQEGVYDLALNYKTDMDKVYVCVQTDEAEQKNLHADDFVLNSSKEKLSTQIWLDAPLDNVEIQIRPDVGVWKQDESMLDVYSVSLSRNTIGSCTYNMLRALGVLIILDIIVIAIIMRKKWADKVEVLLGLGIIVAVSSVGLCMEGMLTRDDTIFQWARVWGLANGIRDGNFPVRIQPEWANGYGYAVSIFYGDLFLYFPALLVLLKLPLYVACKLYLLMVNVGTAVTSYVAFKEIGKSTRIGLLCSAVYSLSIYRMCNVYYRGAVGEYTAMMLLPIVVLGVWNILFGDTEEKNYKNHWIVLSLGMSGIILTHVLSCEMIAFFLFVICIIAFKRVFHKKRFVELCKSVIGTIGLSAAFVVPFMDYSREDLKVFEERAVYAIQEYGISLQQLLGFGRLGEVQSQSEAVTGMAISVGIPVMLMLVVTGYLLMRYRKSENYRRIIGIFCLVFLAFWMATDCFPYDKLERISILKMLIGSLQFPFRFMSIAMVLVTLLICLVAMELRGKLRKNIFYGSIFLLCMIMVGQCVQYWQYVREERMQVMAKVDGAEWTGASLTMYGGQYLYQGTDYFAVMEEDRIGGWVNIEDYQRRGLEYEIICSSDMDTRMELPLFYYPDYRCWDVDTGEQFHVVKGDNNELWIDNIPAEYSGTMKVAFVEPVIWRLAEIVTIITICVYVMGYTYKWKGYILRGKV